MNGSRQSPTFRPNYQSSTISKRSKKSMKPPRKKNNNIIGKTMEGNPIYSRFALANMTIDYNNEKQTNYQRKRISHSEEMKTKQWLRRINFHSYISENKLDLMEDAVRNGILFCELLWFLENIQLFNN